jgi:hypothetical protein
MFGYDYYVNSDLSILANFDASFTDKRIDPIELMLANRNIRDSVILLTEAHQLFDSRFSGSRANRMQGYFYTQTRKLGCHVVYDSQVLGAVDLRLRYINDLEIVCQSYPPMKEMKEFFEYTFYFAGAEEPINHTYVYARDVLPFFDMYNTMEILNPNITANIPLEDIVALYNKAPTKKSFCVFFRSKYPALTNDIAQTVYDFLKIDDRTSVTELLTQEFEYDE